MLPAVRSAVKSLVHMLLLPLVAATAFAPTVRPVTARSPALRSGAAVSMKVASWYDNGKRLVPEPPVEGEAIAVYNALPAVEVQLSSGERNKPPEFKNIVDVVGTSGTSILLGMPGAFTPACTGTHLPGFYESAEKFAEAGVQAIVVSTSNDRFVNAAWQQDMSTGEGNELIKLVSDADGTLTEKLGFYEYLGREYGMRSKRFALVLKDGEVTHIAVDEGTETVKKTSAAAVLKIVTGKAPASDDDDDADNGAVAVGALALAGVHSFLRSDTYRRLRGNLKRIGFKAPSNLPPKSHHLGGLKATRFIKQCRQVPTQFKMANMSSETKTKADIAAEKTKPIAAPSHEQM